MFCHALLLNRFEKRADISIAIAACEAQHRKITWEIATDLRMRHTGSCVKATGGRWL